MEIVNIKKDLDEETLNNLKEALDNPVRLQVVKTFIYNGDIEEAKEIHKNEILMAIVYSKFCEMEIERYNHKMYCMSGFKEQENRLPNKTDKIRIIRGRHYFEQYPDFIISEIGFEIVRDEL